MSVIRFLNIYIYHTTGLIRSDLYSFVLLLYMTRVSTLLFLRLFYKFYALRRDDMTDGITEAPDE